MTKPTALRRALAMVLAVFMTAGAVPVHAESGAAADTEECTKKDPAAAPLTLKCGSQWTARYKKSHHGWASVAKKLAITAGAAAGGALIGSRFGTVGTLAGAAVGAVVGQLLGSHFFKPHREISGWSAKSPPMMGDEGECPPEAYQPPVGQVPRRPVYALGANPQPSVQPAAFQAPPFQQDPAQMAPLGQPMIGSPLQFQGQLPPLMQAPLQPPIQQPAVQVQGQPVVQAQPAVRAQVQPPSPAVAAKNPGTGDGDAAALKSKMRQAFNDMQSAASDGSGEDRMAAKSRYDEAWKAYTAAKSGR